MEFKHWFIELRYEIKENLPTLLDILSNEIEEAEVLITEYDKIKNDRSINRKLKYPKMAELELKLKYKMNMIYVLMMEAIDRLNMFLKKGNNDDYINPIYKK